jgi:hypothetical protein
MLLQIQMTNNHIQNIINDDSYEILELNPSEPIIFKANAKYQQHTYNEKNNQVILIVPRESHTRTRLN